MAKSPAATTPAPKPKKKSPLTAEEFKAAAKPLAVDIAGQKVVANVKEFTTGSFGFYSGGKIVVDVGGVPVECQMSVNITVIGSKPEAE